MINFDPPPPTTKHILSNEVDCPWCVAKAGEDCYFVKVGGLVMQTGEVHIARTKEVPISATLET